MGEGGRYSSRAGNTSWGPGALGTRTLLSSTCSARPWSATSHSTRKEARLTDHLVTQVISHRGGDRTSGSLSPGDPAHSVAGPIPFGRVRAEPWRQGMGGAYGGLSLEGECHGWL